MPKARPVQPGPEEQAWAAHLLLRGERGDEVAFFRFEGQIAFVVRPPPRDGEPSSAVFELLQGAWEAFPGMAHAALRQRIYSTGPARGLDREAVKVAANKLTADVRPEPGPIPNLDELDLTPHATRARTRAAENAGLSLPPPGADAAVLEALHQACSSSTSDAPLPQRDRKVGAALVDDQGRVTFAARNLAGANRTLHAEVNLLQKRWSEERSPLPAGQKVLTTLQPCRMCAAALVQAAPAGLEVVFLEADPGRHARNTALSTSGQERRLERGAVHRGN